VKPGALTQAARSAATRQTGAQTADRPQAPRSVRDAPGERRASRPSRPPRRVSGPSKGKDYANRAQSAARPSRSQSAARPGRSARSDRPSRAPFAIFANGSAAVAAAVALPLRRPFVDRDPIPRRLPKPKPAPAPTPATDRRTERSSTGVLRGIGAFVVSLPDHSLLDRVVRGRAWIPLLGVLLAGIVAAQVETLKLGASMGRSLEQTTTLTSQNELLRDSVAALSDDQRIEHLATNMGMVLPPPGAVGYLTAGRGDGALANIHAPDATAFMALAPSNGALVTGPGTSMLPTSSGVLAQAGTPGSATPTSTQSATSAVTPTGSTASGATTSGTGTTSSAPTNTTTSQAPPAEQPPPATTSTPTTDAPGTTTGGGATSGGDAATGTQSTTDSQTGSQSPTTGAAAIQPATPAQQSSGG